MSYVVSVLKWLVMLSLAISSCHRRLTSFVNEICFLLKYFLHVSSSKTNNMYIILLISNIYYIICNFTRRLDLYVLSTTTDSRWILPRDKRKRKYSKKKKCWKSSFNIHKHRPGVSFLPLAFLIPSTLIFDYCRKEILQHAGNKKEASPPTKARYR